MMQEVKSPHDFFSEDYVREWAIQANQRRPEREAIFDLFAEEVARMNRDNVSIIELGSGPGFLAERLLSRCSIKSYCLFDFSPHMLRLSRDRLRSFDNQTTYVEGNFKNDEWTIPINRTFDIVLALQCVHELRHADFIPKLYSQVMELLIRDGLFLVCDHVNTPARVYEHFMTVQEHIHTLVEVGYTGVELIRSEGMLSLVKAVKP